MSRSSIVGVLSSIALAASTMVIAAGPVSAAVPDGNSTMAPGQSITQGQGLISPNHAYKLVLQRDGNLVEYTASNHVVWTTHTNRASKLVLQKDGNLVLYPASGGAIWDTATSNFPITSLGVRNSGNLVLYVHKTLPVWTRTTGIVTHSLNSQPECGGRNPPSGCSVVTDFFAACQMKASPLSFSIEYFYSDGSATILTYEAESNELVIGTDMHGWSLPYVLVAVHDPNHPNLDGCSVLGQ